METNLELSLKNVLQKQFNGQILSVKKIGGGSYGTAFKVETATSPAIFVAKVFGPRGMAQKEAAALELLAKKSVIKIPKVFFVIEKSDDFHSDILAMEFIEGKNAFESFDLLFRPKKEKQAFANALADEIAAIHSETAAKFGPIDNPSFDSWDDFYRPFAREVFEKAEKMFSKKQLPAYVFRAMQKAWQNYDKFFDLPVSTPCLIHGDLNVMNVMVKKPFEITGIIDPLNSMFADGEYDLFQLNNLTGKKFGLYDTFKSRHQVSKNCDRKCAFYALWNEVYCYQKSGKMFAFIMRPIVKEINKQLKML